MRIYKKFAERVIDTYLKKVSNKAKRRYSEYVLSSLIQSYRSIFIEHLQNSYEYCLSKDYMGKDMVCENFHKLFRQADILPTSETVEVTHNLDMFVWYALHDSKLFFKCIIVELDKKYIDSDA